MESEPALRCPKGRRLSPSVAGALAVVEARLVLRLSSKGMRRGSGGGGTGGPGDDEDGKLSAGVVAPCMRPPPSPASARSGLPRILSLLLLVLSVDDLDVDVEAAASGAGATTTLSACAWPAAPTRPAPRATFVLGGRLAPGAGRSPPAPPRARPEVATSGDAFREGRFLASGEGPLLLLPSLLEGEWERVARRGSRRPRSKTLRALPARMSCWWAAASRSLAVMPDRSRAAAVLGLKPSGRLRLLPKPSRPEGLTGPSCGGM
mmetsp:Transcript_14555/g.44392  ORF Transcript_14555/g.44392 Transcript_14555/m.44392 type:complete len:263 (+) Transcript_14555:565-1353(+)